MSDFRKLDYAMMPVGGGQIVNVSYAVDGDYLYCCSHDQSDNTTSYSRAPLDLDGETEFEPQNNQLPDIDGEWEDYVQRFKIWDDAISEIIESDDIDCAMGYAEEKWQDGSWDEKQLIELYVQEIDWDDKPIGDVLTKDIEVGEDALVPDCTEDEHEWESPHELVGGLTENPGVWSTGGTTYVTKTVCKNCGIYRTETEYGSQRNPQQCDRVEYEDSDDDSLKWVAKANRYIGWYDCVNDRYENHGDVPYETPEEFLDMVLDCWGREDDFQLPAMSCENEDGEIYATTKDGKRELTLVKRVKKDLD